MKPRRRADAVETPATHQHVITAKTEYPWILAQLGVSWGPLPNTIVACGDKDIVQHVLGKKCVATDGQYFE